MTSASDISLIRSATSYRMTSEESDLHSGIMESNSEDVSEDYETEVYEDNAVSSIESDLQTSPQMISGRGALISGMTVPSIDSDEEIEYDGAGINDDDDVENGIEQPPDSDYASHVPFKLLQQQQLLLQRQKMMSEQQDSQQKRRHVPPNAKEVTKSTKMPADMYTMNRRKSETENSDPPELVNIDYSTVASNYKSNRPKRFWYAVLCISLLFIGAIVAISLTVSRSSSDDNLSKRQQEISDIALSISGADVINDDYSPQRKAYNWIVYEDTVFTGTSNKNDEEGALDQSAVVQRYVLAVFYYAMNGPLWSIDDNNWLKDIECGSNKDSWFGVECNSRNQVLSLYLENRGLSGTIPVELGHLSVLENLILSKNEELNGNIPASIGKLSNLRQLNLSSNKLGGTIPSELYLISTLSYLNLEVNGMSGSLSTDIGRLTALQTLALANNTFDGTIPFMELSTSPIVYLGLSSNSFTGSIDVSIQRMTELQYLYLDRNARITGEIPTAIGGATSLKSINLDHTGIKGRIPAIVGRLRSLEYLSIQGSKLFGSIPGEINMLQKLKLINLIDNSLTGTIPNLSALTNLKSLLLVGNRLGGPVEEQLSNLRSLEILFLSSNSFTGPIPTSITRPDSIENGSLLRGLYMSDNKFSGTIPETICTYSKLEALFLDTNQLTGSIPSCLGNLPELRQLMLFNNHLTGTLPIEISTLSKLRDFGIEDNQLYGEVPVDICNLKESNDIFSIWADCGGIQPDLSCTCCTVCCPSEQCSTTSI